MTELHKALYGFWSQFQDENQPIKAYLNGLVPRSATFPYITFEVVEGAFFGFSVLTAICWCKKENGQDANAQRARILDAIALALPEGGTRVSFSGGMVVLQRNEAGFLSYYDDPQDSTVLGGRVSYQIQYFNP